jgi:hypothetical protein
MGKATVATRTPLFAVKKVGACMKEVPHGAPGGQVGGPKGTSAMRQVLPPSRVTESERSVTKPVDDVAKLISIPRGPVELIKELLARVAKRLQ